MASAISHPVTAAANTSLFYRPFTPISVSPLGIRPFLSGRGVAILLNELEWIWLPSAAIAALGVLWRRNADRRISHEGS